ncbi:MAG: squalene/phytoene synthase family protein [Ruegeria sp.]
MEFSDDLNACAALVQRGDPDRFLAVMAAPVAARKVLFPLYALNVEVARAPWVTQEPMIAEMRLQWWRDALGEIASGEPVQRHQVVTPLAAILSAEQATFLDEYVAVRRWDIYKDSFEDAEHFTKYIDQSAGTLTWVTACVLGDAKESVVRDFGFAAGVANWFRAIPELEARGRIPLLDGTQDGVRRLAQEALDRLARARADRSAVSPEARPALLAGWQAGPILHQAMRGPDRVASGTLGQSEFKRRASLMWVAATGRW